jgi:hypothetical protein
VEVSEITQEVLSLVMPRVLFQVRSPQDLEVFAQTFSAHLGVWNKIPELHIELDFTWNMNEEHIIELEVRQIKTFHCSTARGTLNRGRCLNVPQLIGHSKGSILQARKHIGDLEGMGLECSIAQGTSI